jgi:hypothetical protein
MERGKKEKRGREEARKGGRKEEWKGREWGVGKEIEQQEEPAVRSLTLYLHV